jgi:hypothetical protein
MMTLSDTVTGVGTFSFHDGGKAIGGYMNGELHGRGSREWSPDHPNVSACAMRICMQEQPYFERKQCTHVVISVIL